MRFHSLLLLLALAAGLSGCGTVNEKLSAGMGDYVPQWAGGLPADAPPRPGTPQYDAYLKERDTLAQAYDPMSGFKANKNTPFADDSKVEVKLIVDGSAQAQVGVTAGGVQAAAGTPYSFTADAKSFATGPAGQDGYNTVNLVVHAALK